MIRVRTNLGVFEIRDNQILTENSALKAIFHLIAEQSTAPHEGPVDLALFNRMKPYLPDYEILAEKYLDSSHPDREY